MAKHLFLLVALVFSCGDNKSNGNNDDIKGWTAEIVKTETDFCNLAKSEGVNVAFLEYVADDGVLLRNDKLIKGKDSIKEFMKNSTSKGLSWKPDFVDVSKSGDMAYTYGKYKFEYKDSVGDTKYSEGIFHTVWKRQSDNTWKFVWD